MPELVFDFDAGDWVHVTSVRQLDHLIAQRRKRGSNEKLLAEFEAKHRANLH